MHTDTTARRARRRSTRPKIVISALKPKNRPLGRFPLEYVRSVRNSGGDPLVVSTYPLDHSTPPGLEVQQTAIDDTSALEESSGLVLTGGGDVDPSFYGQEPHPRTYNVMRRRDIFEFNLLEAALSRDLPVLAVCRGMQLLNVHLGGTLYQHLTDDPERFDHDCDMVRGEPAHDIQVRKDGPLDGIFGSSELGVNSHHHQALDRVADPLDEVAWAPDGVLEGVVSTEHSFVLGVQWHPEVMSTVYDEQRALFDVFVAAHDEPAASYRRDVRSA